MPMLTTIINTKPVLLVTLLISVCYACIEDGAKRQVITSIRICLNLTYFGLWLEELQGYRLFA